MCDFLRVSLRVSLDPRSVGLGGRGPVLCPPSPMPAQSYARQFNFNYPFNFPAHWISIYLSVMARLNRLNVSTTSSISTDFAISISISNSKLISNSN